MAKNSSWPVTGLGNKGPLKVLNGTKLILDDHGNNLDSFRISWASFRGPLLPKPVTGQELSFAVSYSKPVLTKYGRGPPAPRFRRPLGAMPGLTSCQRKTIVRSSNPNNIMTKPWIFSLKLILFCSLKISVSQEEKERKENSFRHFFNLFMALAAWKTVAWKRHFVGSVPLILWFL